ncbi:uncharacterized protein LOC143473608 [Brachyhypopomus gauderio]|uniref:uncharacterized protein LOC143473608 n=1 Tax=Brachyhypopomus gauderio TaxID=698409 RepID=UPI004040FAEC
MEITVSNSCSGLVPPEKTLQRQISTLSKSMSACLVQRISSCLCQSSTLTRYEVQLIQSQATDIQKASQLVQTLIRKGRRACQLFFKCLGVCEPSLFERVTGCVVTEEDHYHWEDISIPEKEASPPCIINIHNSSLANCIIGNNNDLYRVPSQTHVTNEKMEYAQRADQQMVEREPPHSPSIHLESSYVEYVIIGDNNYMSIETNQDWEQQGQGERETDDSEG